MINKFNDILEQFAREIDQTVELFDNNREAPPVTKNQPPVAGAIKWSRSLLARVKQTMAKLQSTEEEIIRTTGACVWWRCLVALQLQGSMFMVKR